MPIELPVSLPHALPLPGSAWSLWFCAALRAAGFAADGVERFAAPAAAAAADALLDEEERAVGQAVRRLEADLAAGAPGARARNLRRRLHALTTRRDDVATLLADVAASEETREALNASRARVAAARATFEACFGASAGEAHDASVATLRDPRFREAVAWQNRAALARVVARFGGGARPASIDARQREDHRLVAGYLQRYCVKNDTIGFFGPVGWARLGGDDALDVRGLDGFVRDRRVRFEGWAIDAFAQRLAADTRLLPWARPRLLPFFRLDGAVLRTPFHGSRPLEPAPARVVARCDGVTDARTLAQSLCAESPETFASERDVTDLLASLVEGGVIAWDMAPPNEEWPERSVRAFLERVDVEEMRAPWLAALDRLEAARSAVAEAAGDPAAVETALSHLDEVFTEVTGSSPTRSAGATYAARTLVYEDCRRVTEVTVGAPLLARLGPPLDLLLTSARWFTATSARAYRDDLRALVDRLSGGGRTIDLATFQLAMSQEEALVGSPFSLPTAMRAAQIELQSRWAAILALPPGERRVERTTSELGARVAASFDCDGPGWPQARFVSPDVMIAARGAAALSAGEATIVLGEMHLANTLWAGTFVSQHPDPAALLAARNADVPAPWVIPIAPKAYTGYRTGIALVDPADLRLQIAPEPSPAPPGQTLRAADLVVEAEDDGLHVHDLVRGTRVDAIEFFGTLLSVFAANGFSILAAAPHLPRVAVDGVVIHRERWGLSLEDVAFADDEGASRLLAARRWARRLGVPRRFFAKSSLEVKPFFVDLDSPTYVDIFCKAVRRAARDGKGATFSVTEMIPEPEDSWLPDAEGRRYAAELRMVAVDPLRPPPRTTLPSIAR